MTHDADLSRERGVVDVFMAASHAGDFATLLDPDVVLRRCCGRGDGRSRGVSRRDVARQFAGRAHFAQPALVNGAVRLAWALGGQPRVVSSLTIAPGKLVAIDLVADSERLRQMQLTLPGE